MTSRNFLLLLGALGVLAFLALHSPHHALAARPATKEPLYANDFEKAADGDPPKDMTVLSGAFTVKTVDGNKLLELPGDPLDSFGILFGPEGQAYLGVQARIYATSTAKRMPEFGAGLGDSNGYRLWLMPATGQLQILKGEEVASSVAYPSWKSGTWTDFKLQAREVEGKSIVEGKVWPHGTEEPKDWQIKFEDKEAAPKGRASVWGVPYSSTPIRFDDLVVTKP